MEGVELELRAPGTRGRDDAERQPERDDHDNQLEAARDEQPNGAGAVGPATASR